MGWTNATQSSDIESLLRRPNLQRSTDHEFGSRHHQRLGRGDRILLPSVSLPRCRVVNLHTTRSTLTIGYPPRVQRRQTRRGTTPGDTAHFGRNEIKEKDCGRTTAPKRVRHLGAVTRIGSCSLEKRQGRFKRKQCVRSDRP